MKTATPLTQATINRAWRSRSRMSRIKIVRSGFVAVTRTRGSRVNARSIWLVGEPALAIVGRLSVREVRIGLRGIGRVLVDARVVAPGRFVDRIATPIRPCRKVAGANCEDEALRVPGADDHVFGLWRAMHEVPLPQRSFFTFDDQQRLAGEDEEVF